MIEDDKTEVDSFRISLDVFNEDKDTEIVLYVCDGADLKHFEYLYRERIDVIIIDIKLGSNDGNEIIKEIINKKRLPVIIYTGNVNDITIDEPLSSLYIVFDRKKVKHNEMLDYIMEVFNSNYTITIGNNGLIDDEIQNIFNNYYKTFLSDENSQESIMRMVSSIIYDKYSSNDDESLEIQINESYFVNSGRGKTYAGEIYKSSKKYYIITNPPCDIENKNALDRYALLGINIDKYNELIREKIERSYDGINEISQTLKNSITPYINNSKGRFHLIPEFGDFPGGIIDFQDIITVPKKKFYRHKFEYSVTVVPHIFSNILARFSSYYSRQGQMNYSLENLLKKHIKKS